MSTDSRDLRASLGAAAAVIAGGTLAASTAGFFRAFVVAKVFGAHTATDAFFAAAVVPQLVYILFAGGAVSSVLIPHLSRSRSDDEEEMWLVVRTLALVEVAVALAVVVILEVTARPLMLGVASGLQVRVHGDAFPLSVRLVRILALTLPFSALSAAATAALYSLHRRAAAAFAPVCTHVGVITGAVIGAPYCGIMAAAIGAVVGTAVQCAFLLPPLLGAWRARQQRAGARALPLVDLRHPALRRLLRLYLPVAAGLLITTAGAVLNLNFQSRLPESGGLSSMQFATQLVQFPAGIVATGLALAVLPAISVAAGEDRFGDLADTLARGMRACLMLMVPAALGLLVLATPIATLIYQRGQFTALDTSDTASALLGYAPQLPALALAQILIFAFYARHNTVVPALAGAVGVLAYGVMALLLQRFTITGLAAAHTVSVISQTCFLAAVMPRAGLLHALRPTAARITLAAVAMAAVLESARAFLSPVGSGLGTRIADALIPGALGVLAYAAVLVLLDTGEIRSAVEILMRRRPPLRRGVPAATGYNTDR